MNPDSDSLTTIQVEVQKNSDSCSIDLLKPFISDHVGQSRVSRLRLVSGNEIGVSFSLSGHHLEVDLTAYSDILSNGSEELCYEYRINDNKGSYSQHTATVVLSSDENSSVVISNASLTTDKPVTEKTSDNEDKSSDSSFAVDTEYFDLKGGELGRLSDNALDVDSVSVSFDPEVNDAAVSETSENVLGSSCDVSLDDASNESIEDFIDRELDVDETSVSFDREVNDAVVSENYEDQLGSSSDVLLDDNASNEDSADSNESIEDFIDRELDVDETSVSFDPEVNDAEVSETSEDELGSSSDVLLDDDASNDDSADSNEPIEDFIDRELDVDEISVSFDPEVNDAVVSETSEDELGSSSDVLLDDDGSNDYSADSNEPIEDFIDRELGVDETSVSFDPEVNDFVVSETSGDELGSSSDVSLDDDANNKDSADSNASIEDFIDRELDVDETSVSFGHEVNDSVVSETLEDKLGSSSDVSLDDDANNKDSAVSNASIEDFFDHELNLDNGVGSVDIEESNAVALEDPEDEAVILSVDTSEDDSTMSGKEPISTDNNESIEDFFDRELNLDNAAGSVDVDESNAIAFEGSEDEAANLDIDTSKDDSAMSEREPVSTESDESIADVSDNDLDIDNAFGSIEIDESNAVALEDSEDEAESLSVDTSEDDSTMSGKEPISTDNNESIEDFFDRELNLDNAVGSVDLEESHAVALEGSEDEASSLSIDTSKDDSAMSEREPISTESDESIADVSDSELDIDNAAGSVDVEEINAVATEVSGDDAASLGVDTSGNNIDAGDKEPVSTENNESIGDVSDSELDIDNAAGSVEVEESNAIATEESVDDAASLGVDILENNIAADDKEPISTESDESIVDVSDNELDLDNAAGSVEVEESNAVATEASGDDVGSLDLDVDASEKNIAAGGKEPASIDDYESREGFIDHELSADNISSSFGSESSKAVVLGRSVSEAVILSDYGDNSEDQAASSVGVEESNGVTPEESADEVASLDDGGSNSMEATAASNNESIKDLIYHGLDGDNISRSFDPDTHEGVVLGASSEDVSSLSDSVVLEDTTFDHNVELSEAVRDVDQPITETNVLIDSVNVECEVDGVPEEKKEEDVDSLPSENLLTDMVDILSEGSDEVKDNVHAEKKAAVDKNSVVDTMPEDDLVSISELHGDDPIKRQGPLLSQKMPINSDQSYIFSVGDFDPNGNGLSRIRLEALPSVGFLLYNKESAVVGLEVSRLDLLTGRLIYDTDVESLDLKDNHLVYSICFEDQEFKKDQVANHSFSVSVTLDVSANTEDYLVGSGNITIQVADGLPPAIVSGTLEGRHGALTVNNHGYWVYEVDRSLQDLVDLGDNDTLTESISIPTESGDFCTLCLSIVGPYEEAELLLL